MKKCSKTVDDAGLSVNERLPRRLSDRSVTRSQRLCELIAFAIPNALLFHIGFVRCGTPTDRLPRCRRER